MATAPYDRFIHVLYPIRSRPSGVHESGERMMQFNIVKSVSQQHVVAASTPVGSIVYFGDMDGNKLSGYGEMYKVDEVFVGQFDNGNPSGYGMMIVRSLNTAFKGRFVCGQPRGVMRSVSKGVVRDFLTEDSLATDKKSDLAEIMPLVEKG